MADMRGEGARSGCMVAAFMGWVGLHYGQTRDMYRLSSVSSTEPLSQFDRFR